MREISMYRYRVFISAKWGIGRVASGDFSTWIRGSRISVQTLGLGARGHRPPSILSRALFSTSSKRQFDARKSERVVTCLLDRRKQKARHWPARFQSPAPRLGAAVHKTSRRACVAPKRVHATAAVRDPVRAVLLTRPRR